MTTQHEAPEAAQEPSSIAAFMEAVDGDTGDLDAWLECNKEADVRAHIRAAIAQHRAQEAPAELRGLDTSTRVRFYEHDFYVLSNFSAFRLDWKGMEFDTSEHAYHWEKFGTDDEFVSDELGDVLNAIFTAPSAHEAFKVAERNRHLRRPDWDEVKVGIMRDILRAKAAQHEYVRRKLLATGDRELVEDSWRDDFWGWGPNRDGKNMLGRLWMEVRAELRAAPHTKDATA